MFKGKLSFVILAILLTVSVVLSGCTKEKSPKDALQSSMSKSADIKSYNFSGSMKFEDFNFPDDEMSASEAAAVVNLLKSAELSWTGGYRADPMMMEVNLQLALKGDLAINFNIPVLMTEKKVWVKIPNIPMLPIPEDIQGKFIELDLEELAKESGQTIPSIDPGKSQKFSNDVMGILFKHVEEESYLKEIKVKDAGLPADVDVKKVVQFHMDQTQIEPLVNTIVDKIAPELIDLLLNSQEYQDLLQLKKEDLEEAKKSLSELKDTEITEALAEMKKELKSLDITSNIGIDKKEYPVYTDAKISAAIESEELTGSLGIKVVTQMTGINGDVKFENSEPKGDDVITMDQLQEQLGGLYGDMGADSL